MRNSLKRKLSGLLILTFIFSSFGLSVSCSRLIDMTLPNGDKNNQSSLRNSNDLLLQNTESDVSIEFPGGNLNWAELAFLEIEPPAPLYDAEMKVYDLSLDTFENPGPFFNIRISYEDFDLQGEEPEGNLCAAYFDEASGTWKSLYFDIDEENKEVVITTDHFSIYSCFNIVNSESRLAYSDYIIPAKAYEMLTRNPDIFASIGVVKERALTYKSGKYGPDAIDMGLEALGFIGDKLTGSVETAEEIRGFVTGMSDTGFMGDDSITSGLSDWLGKLGLAVSVAQIAKKAVDAYRSKGELDIDDYLEALKGVGDIGVGMAKDYLIENFKYTNVILQAYSFYEDTVLYTRDRAIANEKDVYRKIFKQYYKTKRPRDIDDWVKFLQHARKGALDSSRFQMRIEGEVARYCRYVWQADESDWLDCVIECDFSNNFGGWFNKGPKIHTKLNLEIKETISQEYEDYILAKVIPQAMQKLAEEDYTQTMMKLQEVLSEMRERFNQVTSLNIFDKVAKFNTNATSSSFADYMVYLTGEDLLIDPEWSMSLNGWGAGVFEFTNLAWQMKGKPSKLLLFDRSKDPEEDDPDLIVDVEVKPGYIDVPLEGDPEYPPLSQLINNQPAQGIADAFVCTAFETYQEEENSLYSSAFNFDFNGQAASGSQDVNGVKGSVAFEPVEEGYGDKYNLKIVITPDSAMDKFTAYGFYDETTGFFEGYYNPDDSGIEHWSSYKIEIRAVDTQIQINFTYTGEKKGEGPSALPEIEFSGGFYRLFNRDEAYGYAEYGMFGDFNGRYFCE